MSNELNKGMIVESIINKLSSQLTLATNTLVWSGPSIPRDSRNCDESPYVLPNPEDAG